MKEIAFDNPNSIEILDNVYDWLKKDKKIINESATVCQPPPKLPVIEEIKDSMIWPKI